MKIKTLIKVISIVTFILIGLTGWSIYSFSENMKVQTQTLNNEKELTLLAFQIQEASSYLTNEVRSYTQFGGKVYYDNYWKEINETKTGGKIIARLKELRIPDHLLQYVIQAQDNLEKLVPLEEDAMNSVKEGNFDHARSIVFGPAYNTGKEKVVKPLQDFSKELSLYTKEQAEEAAAAAKWSQTILIISTILLMLSIIITLILIYFKIKPLDKVAENVKHIAGGDLTINELKIRSKDEVGYLAKSFNHMVNNLKTLIQHVNLTSEQVAASSEELMASTEQTTSATNQVVESLQAVAAKIERQEKNTEESARSISDIAVGIQRIAESSSSVAKSVNETTRQANIGNDYLQKVAGQMSFIFEASSETKQVMDKLEARSKEIGNIIEVITNIAEQTNLLALNAAIESARAGEHGKGFAVVADEVRKLAEQSRNSANQIGEIIKLIQSDTIKAVDMTNKGNDEVKSGLTLVDETGNSFNQILLSIESVSSQAQELSAISEEISASAEQVNTSIEEVTELAKSSSYSTAEIASASEEQLATLEEVSASASNLASMAEGLRDKIKQFKL
ncbi:methyl-accepting chemotaxis protein [Bacillus sp. S/N-304-OC-R1]|uniref:methyl-accepting chemotaxis protein n=1 Tax=Bacillus sp. S/N-304-OC-R1 TaxID=2758034 RepID=UPI001C8D32C4|nr:HAMP domain-containing methyl-accepting chemotaxis protein [Bacillus sp. S/N-304-OC-R1]MBY0121173.1 methyl-accepting chemotaxis protein [Bacillus sp. S/N-304-OC-R1]